MVSSRTALEWVCSVIVQAKITSMQLPVVISRCDRVVGSGRYCKQVSSHGKLQR
jgi:hypothetical protein